MVIQRIDRKCSRCGLCARDCVSGVWRVVDGAPEPVAPDLCNRCGHCVAVCPRDAIIHEGLDASQSVRVKRTGFKPDAFRDIVLSRRSVRRFREKPVPREVIERVIGLARYAPTASNGQDVAYTVITDREILRRAAGSLFGFLSRMFAKTRKGLGGVIARRTGLAGHYYLRVMEYAVAQHEETGRDFMLYDAPVLLVLHTPKKSSFGADNCAIAAATIMNYSHALGLGTCFIGFMVMALRYSGRMRKLLAVPAGRKAHSCIVMGYPAYFHARTASRKEPEVRWL